MPEHLQGISDLGNMWLPYGFFYFKAPAGARDFSVLHSVQTGSGDHPASCPIGAGSCFPGGKAAEA
jgi:hypothetical protein